MPKPPVLLPCASIPQLTTKLTNHQQAPLQARLTNLLTRWPSDPVRPASVSVATYLQSHLSPPSESPGKQPQSPPQAPISASSVNALSSLLENRYAREYPLPAHLRRPASNPDYYDNLLKEFEEAPNRDWWGRIVKRVTGLFRMQ